MIVSNDLSLRPWGNSLTKTTERQRVVDLCSRVANIPTTGGHRADRVLLVLADKLDCEATVPESRSTAPAGESIVSD
jgi:hypothetical protein